jgi:chemotaxis response regulator CheB
MPDAAIKTGCVDLVASLEAIPREIMTACETEN